MIKIGSVIKCIHPRYKIPFPDTYIVTSISKEMVGFVYPQDYHDESNINNGQIPNLDLSMFIEVNPN